MSPPACFPGIPQILVFLSILFSIVLALVIEHFLKHDAEGNESHDRGRRARYHIAGLLCRATLLLAITLWSELVFEVHLLDVGTFAELIAIDLAIIAYFSLM